MICARMGAIACKKYDDDDDDKEDDDDDGDDSYNTVYCERMPVCAYNRREAKMELGM